ncbi:hypothetical protein GALMADRAFT_127718 [Galerina marginata CBS 339.88]|uniref:BTB domain-containing protein n=1 Tax=Galerina marginata (strain CBS 339.88) TaxID=685588 RepID=A0A067SHZ5_GALM3|nr:hypothetical protein GALMADRAFT_127718 [Galerina marginata CBS 339.88]
MTTIDGLFYTINPVAQPHAANATAEQPWTNTKFTVYDSDIEVLSADGFIFQLHRVVLGVVTGAFPGSEMETGGEIVQLTEPAKVLEVLFAFLYPKPPPNLQGVAFEELAAVAEAAGKYEAFSAAEICNEQLLKFLPQHAPEILVHAVKHDYPRLISSTLPYLARAPFLSVLEKLPPSFVVPWARYREAWTSLFNELTVYTKNLGRKSNRCHPHALCPTCRTSLHAVIAHLEKIDTLAALLDTLRSPNAEYLQPVFTCCQNGNETIRGMLAYRSVMCPMVETVTALCKEKIENLPSFASFLGIKM